MNFKVSFVVIFIFVIFNLGIWYYFVQHKSDKKRCWNDIDFKEVEQLLLRSSIKKKISIKSYNGEKPDVFLLSFKNGLKAIFKPGRDIMEQASALRGYHLSQILDFKLVPPTIIRTIDGERGMVRLFVDGITGDKYNLKNLRISERHNIYSFYFILGEIDHSDKDIIIGRECNKPALFDSDENMMFFSFIQYGDFPFFQYQIPSLPKVNLKFSDYKQFPFTKVKSIKRISTINIEEFKSIFLYMPSDFTDELIASFNYPSVDDSLYYVKWKNSLWIKLNSNDIYHIYKSFIPSFLSKKTMNSLKKLNRHNLNSLSFDIKIYFNKKEAGRILKQLKPLNDLVLYKRDLFLKEVTK